MAEESIDVPATPKIDTPDAARSRSSEGKPIALKGGTTKQQDPRRASTGSFSNRGRKSSSRKLSSLNSGDSPVPHYLRASSSSCHDFCKYGRKHETEVKPWQASARKVKNPTLKKQNDSETGDLSEKNSTKLVKSKTPPVSKTNSPAPSADFRNKVSSPSNDLAIPSRLVYAKEDISVNEKKKKNVTEKRSTPVVSGKRESEGGLAIPSRSVSAKEGMAVNEKEKNVIAKQNTPVVSVRRVSDSGLAIPSRPVSAKEDMAVNEKKKNVIAKQNTPVVSVRRVSDSGLAIPSWPVSAKEDKAVNEKKKSVIAKRNTQVFSGRSESEIKPDKTKGTSTEMRKLFSSPVAYLATKPSFNGVLSSKGYAYRSKNSISNLKDQNKIKTKDTVGEKTLQVIEVDSKKTIPEVREKNHEGIKEVESKLIENEKITNEILSVLKGDSEKIVPELKQNESTFDAPPSESSSSRCISSPVKFPVLSYGEEGAGDEREFATFEKKVPEQKHNENTTSELFSSLNISSPGKTPALFSGEEEAQVEPECTNIEDKLPGSEQNERTRSLISEPASSRSISSPVKSPTLSCSKEGAGNGLELHTSEKKVPEPKENESTISIPPSELVSFPSISFPGKSPPLSCSEEEAQVEPEYTNTEKKIPELVQNDITRDSFPSEPFSSPNISSLVTSPALPYDKDEAQDEIEYLDTETDGSDDSISESSQAPNSDDNETLVGNHNYETRRAHCVSEENDTATKLKFRRGKVVENESNNNGPRRLRFRRGRVLGEKQEKDVKNRRSFIKGRVDDLDGTNDDSEKVVLRHQEVEGKKDAQGLFNNVIEETASKLVETRKSKVKALVGAFETVISLQESKPATQTAADEK